MIRKSSDCPQTGNGIGQKKNRLKVSSISDKPPLHIVDCEAPLMRCVVISDKVGEEAGLFHHPLPKCLLDHGVIEGDQSEARSIGGWLSCRPDVLSDALMNEEVTMINMAPQKCGHGPEIIWGSLVKVLPLMCLLPMLCRLKSLLPDVLGLV